jgi:hypothetical protein
VRYFAGPVCLDRSAKISKAKAREVLHLPSIARLRSQRVKAGRVKTGRQVPSRLSKKNGPGVQPSPS